jgi:hypothetical protein
MKNNIISPLNQDEFYKELVPFYEGKQAELLGLLKKDKTWDDVLIPYKLFVYDNRETTGNFHLGLTKKLSNHKYLVSQKSPKYEVGFSTQVLFNEPETYLKIIRFLRSVFIYTLIQKASNKNIFGYFERLIKSNYSDYGIEINKDYLRLYIANLKLEGGLFAISAYRVNLIFPFKADLDGNNVVDTTAYSQKILITNRKNTKLFKGFDKILSLKELHAHFSLFHFTEDIQFYRDITKLKDRQIFAIIDVLKTGEDSDIYNLKKELVNINYSKGKEFEKYLEHFLKLCFANCYPKIELRRQVANRKRIRIRDFIIFNNNSENDFLRRLENRGVELLLFDAKNYENELSSDDIDTFTAYISGNRHFGKLGVILSRNGVDNNCKETIFRLLFGDQKIKIIVLTQDDLMKMLDYLNSGRSPIDVIKQKYMELISQS